MTKVKDGFWKQLGSKVGSDDYLLKAAGGYIGVGNSAGEMVPLNNSTLNSGLNADLLDGYHLSDLYWANIHIQSFSDSNTTPTFSSATTTGSPGFINTVTAGSWAYSKFKSGSYEWHIGTNSSGGYIEQAGSFEIRSVGSSYSGISVRYNTSSYGRLVVTSPSGETSIGLWSKIDGTSYPQWVFGIIDSSNYRFGLWNTSKSNWKLNINQNGYVYIGDGNKDASNKLHVRYDSNNSGDAYSIVRFENNTFTNSYYCWGTDLYTPNLANGHNVIHIFGKANSKYNKGYIGFHQTDDNSSSNHVTIGLYGADNLVNITGLGRMGIGTEDPGSTLEICGTKTNTALGINTSTYVIGHVIKDLHFTLNYGSGSGINDGYINAITFGRSKSTADAGIYVQSSGSYGTRMIFGTTTSYSTGSYGRMIIDANGNIGIRTMIPDHALSIAANYGESIYSGIDYHPLTQDGNHRPGLSISGYYPYIWLVGGGAGNSNHGATLTLSALDDSSSLSGRLTNKTFKAWTFGVAGYNSTWMDLGYGTNANPHYHGQNNYTNGDWSGRVMRWTPDETFIWGKGDNGYASLVVNSSKNDRWVYGTSFFAPNLTAGNNIWINIGKANSTRNSFGFTHEHVADGSSNNYGAVEVFNVGNVQRWYYDKRTMFLGTVTIVSELYGVYNEGLRIRDAANKWAGITFGATGDSGISPQSGEVAWFVAKNPGGAFGITPNTSTITTGLELHAGGDLKWRNNLVWHAGNDGSGSGLDADYLDGIDSLGFKTRLFSEPYKQAPAWYRILKIGSYGLSFLITFYGWYNYQRPSPVTFLISYSYDSEHIKITQIGRSAYVGWITKIRVVYVGPSELYLDVYFKNTAYASNSSSGNYMYYEVTPLDNTARNNLTIQDATQLSDAESDNGAAYCETSTYLIADYLTGFGGYQTTNNWPGLSGWRLLTALQDTTKGGEIAFLTNDSGQMSCAIDGYFYQGIDFRGQHRVVDTYDLESYYTKTQADNKYWYDNGNLYQNNSYNANTLKVGGYIFRSSVYGNTGSGSAHANVLNENSTIEVFANLQLSTVAWSDTINYRVKWGGETNAGRPNAWSAWNTLLSNTNYTDYVYSKTDSDNRYVNVTGDTMTGTLIFNGVTASNWCEGIRINDASNGWTTLTMGGSATSGTGTNIWSLHTYDGSFYLAKNGSSSFSNGISHSSNIWTIKATGSNYEYLLLTGSSSHGGMRINAAAGCNPFIRLSQNGTSKAEIGYANQYSNLYLGAYNTDAGILNINITNSRVGIGTTSPTYKLSVIVASDVWHAQFGTSGGKQLRIGGSTPYGGIIGAYNSDDNSSPATLMLQRDGGKVVIGHNSAGEQTLDVNGVQQIYIRGNNNTAFRDLLLLKQQNSSETTGQNWDAAYPTFGIGFRRYWTSGSSPYGETTCAGIYATVSSSWRGGLVFRTKNNETQGGTHDKTALRLRPDGRAEFPNEHAIRIYSGSYNHHPITDDGAGRPGISISGNYPYIWLQGGGTSNTSHGATITLAAPDSVASTGAFKAWTFGVPGQGATWMDLGYGTSTNPHAHGINNYSLQKLVRFNANPRQVYIEGPGNDSNATLIVQSTRASTWVYGASFLDSNLDTGHNIWINIGKYNSTRNSFGLSWHHAGGDGSTSNYGAIEIWGVGNVQRWYASGTTWHSGQVQGAGFYHTSYGSSEYLLRSDGGVKAVSDFALAHSHPYVAKAGDTMTGPLTISSSVSGNYNEGLRITRASNSWAGITFGSTGTAGAPTGGWFVATNPSNQFIINPDDSGSTAGLTLNKGGNAYWRNSVILTAGNWSSYISVSGGDYLPLSGGTLTSSSLTNILNLNGSAGSEVGIRFLRSGTTKGWVGYMDGGYMYMYNAQRGNYLRYNDNGTLTFEGNTVWHSGNDGSGSGLDADKVDGLHFWTGSSIPSSPDSNTIYIIV